MLLQEQRELVVEYGRRLVNNVLLYGDRGHLRQPERV